MYVYISNCLVFIGPAAYDPNVKAITDKSGKLVYKERRFKDLSKEDVPGPGTYEVRTTQSA